MLWTPKSGRGREGMSDAFDTFNELWPERVRNQQWCSLPNPGHETICRAGSFRLRNCGAVRPPLVPIKRHLLRSPLLLETESSGINGATAEVERVVSVLSGEAEHLPVHEHVRLQIEIFIQRRCPDG